MVNEALEEFAEQVDIELANPGAGKLNRVFQTRPAGAVQHHSGKRFVQRYISVTITADPALVAQRLVNRLAQGNANILDRVMGVDVQIALCFDVQIDQTVTSDLVEHVVEKRQSGGKLGITRAVEIDPNLNPGFQSVALDRRDACRHENSTFRNLEVIGKGL